MHTGASLWCKAVAESLPCVHQGELGSSCNYPWAPSQKVRITFCKFFLQPYLILFDSCSRRHVQHVRLSWISLWIWGFWSSLQIGPKWCWKSPSSMQALYKLNVVTHVPIFGSPVLVGKSKGNRFTAVCRCYIYININFCSSILSVVDAVFRQVSQTVRLAQWWMHTRKPARAETQEIWMIWNDLKKEMTGIRFGAQRNCWAPIDFGYLPGTANQTANWNDSAVLNEEIAFLFLFGA